MLVESSGSAKRFNIRIRAEPGKLDIKSSKPGILFISLQAGSLFKQAIMT